MSQERDLFFNKHLSCSPFLELTFHFIVERTNTIANNWAPARNGRLDWEGDGDLFLLSLLANLLPRFPRVLHTRFARFFFRVRREAANNNEKQSIKNKRLV